MKQRILFIINPISGTRKRFKKKLPDLIREVLDPQKFDFAIKYTEAAGHARTLAGEAVHEKFDIVAVAGGDGSINEVASALVDTGVAMAILPLGSGNGLAHALHFPTNVKKALQAYNKLKIQNIDVCRYQDKIFCSAAGVGFDAYVAELFEQSKLRGFFSYAYGIMRAIFEYPFFDYQIETNEKQLKGEAFIITIFNSNQYGYNVKVTPEANLQDGIMDVFILEKFPKWKVGGLVFDLLRGHQRKNKYFKFVPASKVKITTPDLVHLHIDGDRKEKVKELEVEVLPQKLKVLIP